MLNDIIRYGEYGMPVFGKMRDVIDLQDSFYNEQDVTPELNLGSSDGSTIESGNSSDSSFSGLLSKLEPKTSYSVNRNSNSNNDNQFLENIEPSIVVSEFVEFKDNRGVVSYPESFPGFVEKKSKKSLKIQKVLKVKKRLSFNANNTKPILGVSTHTIFSNKKSKSLSDFKDLGSLFERGKKFQKEKERERERKEVRDEKLAEAEFTKEFREEPHVSMQEYLTSEKYMETRKIENDRLIITNPFGGMSCEYKRYMEERFRQNQIEISEEKKKEIAELARRAVERVNRRGVGTKSTQGLSEDQRLKMAEEKMIKEALEYRKRVGTVKVRRGQGIGIQDTFYYDN